MTARATPIVALDVGSRIEALALARRVGPAAAFFKVGSELFTAAGLLFRHASLAGLK